MKKILIAALLVIFIFSSTALAARWGIGVMNLLGTYDDEWDDNLIWLINPAATIFYNFNDQHSIEGTLGFYSRQDTDGGKRNITLIGLRYLYNFIASKRLNARVGIQAMTSVDDWGPGDKEDYTEISLLFGGEAFITDNLSVIADILASFTDFTEDGWGRQETWINLLPLVSLRIYIP